MEKVSTIFINNLPPDATQDELIEKFNEYGSVKAVRLLRANNGECRGFAFLDYDTEEEASRAINEGNDTKFHGCKIKVERSRHQLGDPPRSKRHLRDRPPINNSGITSSQSASYIRRREESPMMQSSPRGRNIVYGQNFQDNSPPLPQQYRFEAYVHKIPPSNYSNIPQYPPIYRYRDSPPPRYRNERDYPYEPRRYVDREYEMERDYLYRERDRHSSRDRMIYRDSPPQQNLGMRRVREDYPYDSKIPIQSRNSNYRDRVEDSPPIQRRIVKDDSPPPRRILDDDDDSPLPTRRIIADDDSPLPPPPRRIIDDDSPSPPPPKKNQTHSP